MNHATRAIVMAAGRGERLYPVTETTPKPLVSVRGRRMLDTIVEALHENGIYEIYVVVGYRKEQFAGLPEQYPGLRLIENPDWNKANNISSLYYAREHLGSCIILDGDQIIRDPSILRPDFVRSCYCAHWTDVPTKEWILTVEDELVTACARNGGERGWALCSVSLWTQADGERLRRHLEQEYPGGQSAGLYWDDVALFCHPEDYCLGLRPIPPEALTEIDSLEELRAASGAGDETAETVSAER